MGYHILLLILTGPSTGVLQAAVLDLTFSLISNVCGYLSMVTPLNDEFLECN